MQALGDFLRDPVSYRPLAQAYGLVPGDDVERIETHAAQIFLCGEIAVKIKSPVQYSFLDFSSVPKRLQALQRELDLNSRGAPDLYLQVVAIERTAAGELCFAAPQAPSAFGRGSAASDACKSTRASGSVGNSAAVTAGQTRAGLLRAGQTATEEETTRRSLQDWVLVMRCFDNSQRLDRLCERGALDAKLLRQFVDQLHDYHNSAEVRSAPFGGGAALERIIQQNAQDFAQCPGLFKEQRIEALLSSQRQALAAVQTQLDLRRDSGWVRRGHGDLHLGNLVVWRDRPVLFDAIEFDEDIGTEDLLYDLSFLLMDLRHRGQLSLANLALNRFLGRRGGYDALAALRLMLSLRAAIRAKVGGLTAQRLADEGQRAELVHQEETNGLSYLALAEDVLRPEAKPMAGGKQPLLLAIGGLSGTGKSTLATSLAPDLAGPLGAIHLRSDMIRKRLMGVLPETPLGLEAYEPEVSQKVYQTLFQEAETALAAGYAVIADAVWAREAERIRLQEIAAQAGVAFKGLWLEAPQEELLNRVTARRDDVSDAGPAVVLQQADYDLGEITWTPVHSGGNGPLVQEVAQILSRV